MNEKMCISRKYNKLLNILLGIYITLCLVLSLLYNGFFVNSKAYQGNFPDTTIRGTCSYNGTLGIVDWKFSQLNDPGIRSIWYVPEPGVEDAKIYLIYNYNAISYNRTIVVNNGIAWYGNFNDYTNRDRVNAEIGSSLVGNERAYEIKMGGEYMGYPYKCDFDFASFDSIEYVTTVEDVNKFFNNNDDSVVNIGNPFNPPLTEDNSLPVPQSLTCDLKNNDEGAPRFMAGSWKNPSSLLASYDADEINIEIQYKPKLQFYKKLFDLKLGVGTSSTWMPLTKKKISQIDNWVSYMNLSDNNPTSTGKSFHKNGKEDIENIASQNDYNNISSHVELLNGSSWRCRYEVNGNTSLWVVYGVDSINQFGRPSNSGDNITFENASGDSISASEVAYNNSNMTDKSYDNLSFLGKIRYDLDNLFTSLKSFFTPLDNNSGFYAFFGRVFEQFPIFWTLFILGLVVAILLRIFGR